jgi:hypothetical protein
VLSSWGQELSVEIDDPYVHERISTALRHCDGFIADCYRDLRIAESSGLSPSKIAFEQPPPGNGGLDLSKFGGPRPEDQKRSLIIVPKSYESINHKALCILEALQLAEDALQGYEVHLLMCSQDVQMWLRRMPESFQQHSHN